MKKLYPDAESRVNPSGASETKKPQDFPDRPARPQVERPKRSFVKSPIVALAAKIKDPNDPLKKCHLPVLQIMMSYAHRFASGERGLAFPSQQTIADELGEHRNTVGRHQAAIVKSGLMIKYKARMAVGREDGGQWAQPYYDMAPVFQMCGEDVVPRSMKQVKQYLDEAGYWRRGMKLVREVPEAPGAPGGEGPKALDSDGDRAPFLHTGDAAEPLQDEGDTVHQKGSTNKNPSSDFVKKTKYTSGPKPLHGVESLPAAEQAVYCRLKEIRYTPFKAVHDLKKYGAAYVEARLDFVLRDTKGVNDKARMLNHWMERLLEDAYSYAGNKPKPVQAKAAAPQSAAPAAPRPATGPSPAAEPKKTPTMAEQRDALLLKVEGYDAKVIALGRAHAKGDRDLGESLRQKLDLPLPDMSIMALQALLDHCQVVAAKMGAAQKEEQ